MATRTALARHLIAACLALGWNAAAQAGGMMFCDRPAKVTATAQDHVLRFSAVVKEELERSGATAAVVSRAGLDLARLGLRYSHAGLALKFNPNSPWSVRQLYYACDERQPRLFDQGMAGFLSGASDVRDSRVALVFVPAPWAAPLARVATDNAQSLGVLGASYSANAYPFSTRYQNCNQWVMELFAIAWGGIDDTHPAARERAQAWLAGEGYEPTVFQVHFRPLQWVVGTMSLLHNDDHPGAELAQGRYAVSMPQSVDAFLRTHVPGVTRMELCHAGRRVVVHRGWDEIAEDCTPAGDDRTLDLAP